MNKKFEVGQLIRQKITGFIAQIVEISEIGYHCDNAYVPFTAQDQWELVEIKFKVGDTIRVKSMKVYDKTFIGKPAKIVGISSKGYLLDDGNICDFSLQKGWELVEEPDGYGISQEQVDRLINHMKEVKELLKKEEPVSEETMTIRKEWFEYCKKSWYNEGYIDGKYNRKSQFEKPVSEDLEKEISNNWETGYELGIGFSQYADVARHFANWQKQQMIKNAVETIIDNKPNNYGEFIPVLHVKLDSSYKDGEKVRVIIIKKE